MQKLQIHTPLTEDHYTVITALRGPDNQVLSDALKWVITGRIRFYVSFASSDPRDIAYTVRMDTESEYRWKKVHEACDQMFRLGVPESSLHHWALHADHALAVIWRKCLNATDHHRRLEINAMQSVLKAVRIALGAPGAIKHQHYLHDQLERLQHAASCIFIQLDRVNAW